jgi:hypothetical protein
MSQSAQGRFWAMLGKAIPGCPMPHAAIAGGVPRCSFAGGAVTLHFGDGWASASIRKTGRELVMTLGYESDAWRELVQAVREAVGMTPVWHPY